MGITITWLQSSLQTPQKPNPTAVGRDNVVAVQSPDSTKTKYRFSEWNQDVNCVIDFRKLGELQRANMFRSQVAVVWFLFFFLVCNAGDQEVAAETLEFSSKDSHLFNQTYPKALLAIDKCPKLKIIMSNIYPGFGETMTNCTFDVLTEVISTKMDYRELMKKGYCCSEHSIYRRIYWSIHELLYKGESGE
ncbi:unnamed protein product [Schistosoma intercalatum]|nr:unnamed protein product [Schistosoma intercalatum]